MPVLLALGHEAGMPGAGSGGYAEFISDYFSTPPQPFGILAELLTMDRS